MKKPLKVLVPIDFSQHSLGTLRFAGCLREMSELHAVLLHVVPAGGVESFAEMGGVSDEVLGLRIDEAMAELEHEAVRVRTEFPDGKFECRVVAGIPFKEICRLADEEKFQLIVIGTHGRTGLAHLLIGSTAERVVQHAACPVLSVKPRVL